MATVGQLLKNQCISSRWNFRVCTNPGRYSEVLEFET